MKRAYVFILGDRAGLVLAITRGKAKEACCQGRVPGCSGTLRLDHPQGYCLPPTAACTAAELPGRDANSLVSEGTGISQVTVCEASHVGQRRSASILYSRLLRAKGNSRDKDCTFLSPSPYCH